MREYIRWMLLHPEEEKNYPEQKVASRQANFAVIAAFSVAVDRALGDTPSSEQIRQLVKDIRGTYVSADRLPPAQAEAVIRGILGDVTLFRGMPLLELMQMQLSLTYGIVHHLGLAGPEYEAFLDLATDLTAELAADPG